MYMIYMVAEIITRLSGRGQQNLPAALPLAFVSVVGVGRRQVN